MTTLASVRHSGHQAKATFARRMIMKVSVSTVIFVVFTATVLSHASIGSELRLAASCSQSELQVFRERIKTSYKIFHPWFRLKTNGLRDALTIAWAIQFLPMSGKILANRGSTSVKFR
jgi:hypothetical protein